jgi:hypothetical protein
MGCAEGMKRVCNGATKGGSSLRDAVERESVSSTTVLAEESDFPGGGVDGWDLMGGVVALRAWT